jgi:hypothetical protein
MFADILGDDVLGHVFSNMSSQPGIQSMFGGIGKTVMNTLNPFGSGGLGQSLTHSLMPEVSD